MTIQREALKAIVNEEFAKGLSCTGRLIQPKYYPTTGAIKYPGDASTTCGDVEKCIMGAILCASGFTVQDVNMVQLQYGGGMAGLPFKFHEAIFKKFGIWPGHSGILLGVNDNTLPDTRQQRLLDMIDRLLEVNAEFPTTPQEFASRHYECLYHDNKHKFVMAIISS